MIFFCFSFKIHQPKLLRYRHFHYRAQFYATLNKLVKRDAFSNETDIKRVCARALKKNNNNNNDYIMEGTLVDDFKSKWFAVHDRKKQRTIFIITMLRESAHKKQHWSNLFLFLFWFFFYFLVCMWILVF